MITDVPCPAKCYTLSDKGVKHPGYLHQVDSEKLFCITSGCKFAYIDEHKIEVWMGGEIVMFDEVIKK